MLFIAEGIDGSGKTTLITELSDMLTDGENPEPHFAQVLHSGPLDRHPLEAYVHRIMNYDPTTDHILADRWHVGELIYGPLYRGESQLTPAMTKYVDLFLESKGAVKLIMGTSFEVVELRLKQRGEKFLKEQHRRLVFDAYSDRCTYMDGWTTVGTNWRSDGSLPKLVTEGALRECDAEGLMPFSSYVGPAKPITLLLGETRGQQRPGRPRYRTAFVPYRDTSGHFLFTALTMAPPTVTYGVANAKDENLPNLLKVLDNPRVVCLGQAAQTEFINQVPSYSHKRVNHPSYVRRFSAGAIHQYATLLQEAISTT